MKKISFLLIFFISTVGVIGQNLVYEQTFIKAHNVSAYDDYIENVFAITHQQRLDAGIIVGWDVWKVVDNPSENFTHMLTTIYDIDMQSKIDEFQWTKPDYVSQRDLLIKGKDLEEVRDIVAVAKYMGLASIRKKGTPQVPEYLAFNLIKLKGDKWKSYEDAELNGTKSIDDNSIRVGWDFARRIDDYGTDISHTHVTVDWYTSHADYLKTFMGKDLQDASKEYQQMLKLRDLKYRVLMKLHKSMR
ncbi:MAG: hypothetical protein O3C13_04465 [Bacteroidetes bacterium]|nr:hypothetical protein [Bacteroidota bacterium]